MGAWAWSVWFRHEEGVNFPNYQREQFFGHGDPTQPTPSANQIHVQFEKSGAIRIIVADSEDGDLDASEKSQDTPPGLNLEDGKWHHLVLSTRDDSLKGFNVYIDGVQRASGGAGGDKMNPDSRIRLCGRETSSGFNELRYFRGQVAHFSVWDSALSDAEVDSLYLAYTSEFNLPAPSDFTG